MPCKTRKEFDQTPSIQQTPRKGAIAVLSAFLIVFLFGMVAFAIDLGYIALAKTQLQLVADSSALSAALELEGGLGIAPTQTPAQAADAGRLAAFTLAALHPNGDLDSTYLDTGSDLRFGTYNYDVTSGQWTKSWEAAPYNMVEVSARRNAGGSGGDRSLDLLFAPTLGLNETNLTQSATAALQPGVGVRITPGSGVTCDVLPIALDVPSWNALIAGTGEDNFRYNPQTGAVSGGSDGILEISLYPYGNQALPPGNRGTVDLGSPNNSTNDLKRQILYGLNENDLSYFGGELRTDNGPLIINGDTGISAGIKAELEAIKGQPRLIPLFTSVSGPGNNAMYTVVKFVGIRIMYVKLTGGTKTVIVQPAPFVSSTVIKGNVPIAADSYFTKPRLID